MAAAMGWHFGGGQVGALPQGMQLPPNVATRLPAMRPARGLAAGMGNPLSAVPGMAPPNLGPGNLPGYMTPPLLSGAQTPVPGTMTPARAPRPPPQGSCASNQLSQQQRNAMAAIVRGMQNGNIGMVAEALSGAVRASVSIPDEFLVTVKTWMDSRQQSSSASAQMSQMASGGLPTPGTSAPTVRPSTVPASFQVLHQQLEDAIRRNDQVAMQAILQQAAQLAATGGVSGSQLSGLPSPPAHQALSLTPGPLGGAATPVLTPPPGGAFGQLAAGYASHSMAIRPPLQGAATPFLHGAVTPVFAPGTAVGPGAAFTTPHAAKRRKRAAKKGDGDAFSATVSSPTFVPEEDELLKAKEAKKEEAGSSIYAPADPLQATVHKTSRGLRARWLPSDLADAISQLETLVESKSSALPVVGKTEFPVAGKAELDDYRDDGDWHADEPMDLLPELKLPLLPSEPSAEEIVEFLRTQDDDSSRIRKVCSHFQPPATSEYVRRAAESKPGLLDIVGDRIMLRDPKKKESLQALVRELVRKPLTRKRISPEQAREPIWRAASFAFEAYPDDVKSVLLEVSKNVLRRTGPAPKGKYPANMPLVLACLIDCIVRLERQRLEQVGSGKPRFATVLGPVLHQIVFSRWVAGVIPGSQFLVNLLLTWDQLEYFKPQDLAEPRKSLWLLLAYARKEGVAEKDRDDGVGWYRIVARGLEQSDGCEAIMSKMALEAKRTQSATAVHTKEVSIQKKEEDAATSALFTGQVEETEEPPSKRMRVEMDLFGSKPSVEAREMTLLQDAAAERSSKDMFGLGQSTEVTPELPEMKETNLQVVAGAPLKGSDIEHTEASEAGAQSTALMPDPGRGDSAQAPSAPVDSAYPLATPPHHEDCQPQLPLVAAKDLAEVGTARTEHTADSIVSSVPPDAVQAAVPSVSHPAEEGVPHVPKT